MRLTNYHTHCNYCDGKGHAEEYYTQAKSLGMAAIGFSSHAPVPFENDFAASDEALPSYVDTIRRLKQQAQNENGPQVYLGLEIDFIPGIVTPIDSKWEHYQLDYKIGSVHALNTPKDGTPMLAVDGPINDLNFMLRELYSGDVRALVRDYYTRVDALCSQGGFDILGHYDLVKKHNQALQLFDESETWYREAAIDTLDTVAKAGCVMEINSGGIARGSTNDVYPPLWLLKEAHSRKIPVQINADAHSPSKVDFHYQESLSLAKQAGYRSLRVLLNNQWQDVAI